MKYIIAILATLCTLVFATPAYASQNECAVSPNPVPWTETGTLYSITAQLRPLGWYSIRIDVNSRDHFGHHEEGAPFQLDETGFLQVYGNTNNGPRDSLFPGDEARVFIRSVSGTGGGGAHCEFTVT